MSFIGLLSVDSSLSRRVSIFWIASFMVLSSAILAIRQVSNPSNSLIVHTNVLALPSTFSYISTIIASLIVQLLSISLHLIAGENPSPLLQYKERVDRRPEQSMPIFNKIPPLGHQSSPLNPFNLVVLILIFFWSGTVRILDKTKHAL